MTHNLYNLQEKLISKHMGGQDTSGATGLQRVDYSYNIRGWLQNINNTDNLYNGSDPLDLFAFKINYDTLENDINHTLKPLYNVNIAETFWKTSSDNTLRKYGYQYDNLNRLRASVYQKPNAPVNITNSYNESMEYDKNGNIIHKQL